MPQAWEQLCLFLKRQKQLFSSESCSAFLFLFSLSNNLEADGLSFSCEVQKKKPLVEGMRYW